MADLTEKQIERLYALANPQNLPLHVRDQRTVAGWGKTFKSLRDRDDPLVCNLHYPGVIVDPEEGIESSLEDLNDYKATYLQVWSHSTEENWFLYYLVSHPEYRNWFPWQLRDGDLLHTHLPDAYPSLTALTRDFTFTLTESGLSFVCGRWGCDVGYLYRGKTYLSRDEALAAWNGDPKEGVLRTLWTK